MKVEFKPCKKCGNTGENPEVTEDGGLTGLYVAKICRGTEDRAVECGKCGHHGPVAKTWDDARIAWNTEA